jgi:hypothetical protein
MVISRGCSEPNRRIREYLDYRSDEAKEERDVMTCDIPNTFIQGYLPKKEPGEDRVVMKITGVLADMLVDINPELYGPAIVMENQKKVV